MNLYYSLLDALLLISAGVLLRHSWYRSRYFLQMFQQHGYKQGEFSDWLVRHLHTRMILAEHYLFLIIITALMVLMSERVTMSVATLVVSMFMLFWFSGVSRFRPEQDKKPLVFTPRMTRLAAVHGLLVLIMVLVVVDLAYTGQLTGTPLAIRTSSLSPVAADPWFLSFGLILIDLSIPLYLKLAAWLLKPVENRIQEGFKRQARSRLAQMPDLKVIAITGSYGKTSTKMLLDALLRERYHVCSTPGSYNTPMGICKVINNDLEPSHQILILEMGARYEGNILELCRIARPDVSVITNVGKAHLESFGSVEAIAREKGTLAREVSHGGLLVLNADDPAVDSMAELNPDARVVRAGVERGDLRADEISYSGEGTRFSMITRGSSGEERTPISMKLLGLHNVQNFLMAAAVARSLGIRPATIALAASRVEPVEHRLELKRRNGLTIIDDAFNSNPEGARNAVEILAGFQSGRRVIITPGMVELGELQEEENRKFGERIADAGLDLVVLVGRRQTAPILEGIRSRGRETRVEVVDSLFEANELVQRETSEGDVVLYENDLPDTYNE